jgi:hypothetical protein
MLCVETVATMVQVSVIVPAPLTTAVNRSLPHFDAAGPVLWSRTNALTSDAVPAVCATAV